MKCKTSIKIYSNSFLTFSCGLENGHEGDHLVSGCLPKGKDRWVLHWLQIKKEKDNKMKMCLAQKQFGDSLFICNKKFGHFGQHSRGEVENIEKSSWVLYWKKEKKVKYPDKDFQRLFRDSLREDSLESCCEWGWEKIEEQFPNRCEALFHFYNGVVVIIEDKMKHTMGGSMFLDNYSDFLSFCALETNE